MRSALVLALTVALASAGCVIGESPWWAKAEEADEATPTTDSDPWLDDTAAPTVAPTVSPSVVSPPFEAATFDAGSMDEDIAWYVWSLVSAPEGSAVFLPPYGDSTVSFTPDLAGSYEVSVEATDRAGHSSEPGTVALEAVPAHALWIEMFWSLPGDDMDLHLLAPGGTLETDLDCYYLNCVGGGLDWGVRGDAADDPSLDLDDISGVGPENINITSPQDGSFEVWVHDYQDSFGSGNGSAGANEVTLQVWIDGVMVWSRTRTVHGEDSYTSFCSVTMPEGSIARL
jgi:hypothetical protein